MPRIWHPFTQMQDFTPRGTVVGAEGAWLHLDDGRHVLDGIASWWVTAFGHRHPHLVRALTEQAQSFCHVIAADLDHEPAARLTRRLAEHLPGDLQHVFFSDDGSTSVEVALKLCWQAQRKTSDRHRFVAFEGAYHGDTLGAMSVGCRDVFTAPFDSLVREAVHLPYDDAEAFEAWMRLHGDEVVAVIIEPLLQGASGMRLQRPETLARIARATREAGALLIADEVATGFGRVGSWFAVEQADVVPDVICLSKALTGGTLPMGVTAVGPALYERFLSNHTADGFLHGHSYTANALGCAVANAALDLLESTALWRSLHALEADFTDSVERFRKLPAVGAVRHLGAVFAVELEGGPGGWLDPAGWRVCHAALERGLYLRPLGNVVYLLPPLNLTAEERSFALDALYEAVLDATR